MPGYKWVRYSGARYFVPGMLSIGRDLDGMNLVVGRALHHGDMLPAKVKPEHGVAYVCHNGKEHMKHDFEILMPADFKWVRARGGQVPLDAVEAGTTAEGEMLYVGRAYQNGVPCVGKLLEYTGCSFGNMKSNYLEDNIFFGKMLNTKVTRFQGGNTAV